jgi:hypothetical protein
MPNRRYPYDVLEQAIAVQEAWSQIDDHLAFGPLTMTALANDISQLRSLDHSIASLESKLTELENQREEACANTWDKVKRARAGVKAAFGDDSSQFEMIGGTRLSDRKSPRRTPQPAQAASA